MNMPAQSSGSAKGLTNNHRAATHPIGHDMAQMIFWGLQRPGALFFNTCLSKKTIALKPDGRMVRMSPPTGALLTDKKEITGAEQETKPHDAVVNPSVDGFGKSVFEAIKVKAKNYIF